MALNPRELATILAALRWWQGCIVAGKDMHDEMDIAEDGGTLVALSVFEIDKLCERLNYEKFIVKKS